MPRIRTLKPELLQHRKVGRLSDRAFRLWIGMITQADDHGRFRMDYEQLRVIVWGYHTRVKADDVRRTIDEITRASLVRDWVTADGEHCAYFPSWIDHQRVQHPSPSLIPEPPFYKEAIPGEVRVALAERHGVKPGESGAVKCHYCETTGSVKWWLTSRGKPSAWVSFQDLEMDHAVPESQGGPSTAENIVLSCRKCNRSKGPRTGSGTFMNVPEGSEGIGSEGREGSIGPRAEAPWPSPESLVSLYNAQAPDECPAVATLSPKRMANARKLLAAFPEQAWWEQVFAQMHASRLLRGLKNGPGHDKWVADFDWLLAGSKSGGTENCVLVHDGRYLDG